MQKSASPTFGGRIRTRREELRLTRPQLLAKVGAGLSLSTLINIENHNNVPRAHTLAKIAAALDLSVDDLLGVIATDVAS